jgi:hydroxymethylglutaryl-CoA lyase
MKDAVVQWVECPRDAMQGLKDFVPTEAKISYLNALLRVGFHTLDFGSFVSPKTIPQLRDTAEVLANLDTRNTQTRLLAIVANLKGAELAGSTGFPIQYLGFPLSVSETFQQRNTNKSIAEALAEVQQIYQVCQEKGIELVVYLSMGFGNPYGEPYAPELLVPMVGALQDLGITTLSLADTIGSATPELITGVFRHLSGLFPEVVFGAHFHTLPHQAQEKIEAAWQAGCRRFDTAIGGMGGCPMAKDELTGNLPSEALLSFLQNQQQSAGINSQAFTEAVAMKKKLFDS